MNESENRLKKGPRQENRPQEDKRTVLKLETGEITSNGYYFLVPTIVAAFQGQKVLGGKSLIIFFGFGTTEEEITHLTTDYNSGRARTIIKIPIGQKTAFVQAQIAGSATFSKKEEIILPELKKTPPTRAAGIELKGIGREGEYFISITAVSSEGIGIRSAGIRVLCGLFPNSFQDITTDDNGVAEIQISGIPAGRQETVVFLLKGTNIDTKLVLSGPRRPTPTCDSTGCPQEAAKSFLAGWKARKEADRRKE